MTYHTIELAIENNVAVLAFNRPDKLNSMTAQMHVEIRDALEKIDAAGTRAMVLTANGRGFCAGQDLADVDLSKDLSEILVRDFNPLVRWIKSREFPVICAVNGIAAGAGANVALACDIILAAKSASFLQAFAKIGLIPDAGGTWSLTHLVGPHRARALAMLAEPLSAEKALEWGLVWEVVEDDELRDKAVALAKRMATQPTRSFALSKRAIDAALGNDFSTHLDSEAQWQDEAGRTHDYREGVNAFLEKRKPVFQGK